MSKKIPFDQCLSPEDKLIKALRTENADLKSTLHHAAQMEALDKATIAQQAAVIEQTREAFRVASMDTETINRKAPEIAKGCCSMPMPDTEGMYRLANEEVCNVVSSYLYWLHKNQPTALHPSPEILEALDGKAVILRATIKAQEHWQEQVVKQAAVIEQMPVAWLHQKRTPSDVITDEVKMFLLRQYERWEFHSSVQRHSVCKAENYTIPLYLHPSTKEVEARDERVAEACAKAVIADNGQCDSHVIASQLVCGEWRKYV